MCDLCVIVITEESIVDWDHRESSLEKVVGPFADHHAAEAYLTAEGYRMTEAENYNCVGNLWVHDDNKNHSDRPWYRAAIMWAEEPPERFGPKRRKTRS